MVRVTSATLLLLAYHSATIANVCGSIQWGEQGRRNQWKTQHHRPFRLLSFAPVRKRNKRMQCKHANRIICLQKERSKWMHHPALHSVTRDVDRDDDKAVGKLLSLVNRARTVDEIDFIMNEIIASKNRMVVMSLKQEAELVNRLGQRKAYDSLLAFLRQGRSSVFTYNAAIIALSRSSSKFYRREALNVLDDMDAKGVEPTSYTFTALFSSIDGAQATMRFLERSRQYKNQTGGIHVYNAAIHACSRISSPKSKSSGGRISSTDWQTALGIFSEMRKQGINPNRQTYGSLLHACAQSGQVRIALSLLREMQNSPGLEPNAQIWGAVLNACAKAGDYKEAILITAEMQLSNSEPNLKHCSSLLSALAEGAQDKLALKFLEGMQTGSQVTLSLNSTALTIMPPPPDLVTINTVLASFSKAKNYKGAKQLLEQMKSGEFVAKEGRAGKVTQSNRHQQYGDVIRPDIISYNTVMSACSDSEEAKELIKEMRLSRRYRHGVIPPTSISYVHAIKACRNRGVPDMDAVRFLLETARNDGMVLNVFIYSAAIWTAECGGDYKSALSLLNEMKSLSDTESGCRPNAISYDGVISALAANGLAIEAISLFEEMKRAKLTPTPITFQRLVTAVSTESSLQSLVVAVNSETSLADLASSVSNSNKTSNQIDDLNRIVQIMDKSDILAGSLVIEALICAYGSESSGYNDAKRVFTSVEGRADPICIRAMMFACSKASPARWFDALSILHRSDIVPGSIGPAKMDPRALSYAISACCKENRYEEALNLVRLYGQPTNNTSSVVSSSSFNALISACGRGGRPDIALQMLDEMESIFGVTPTERSYRSAMIVCNQAEHGKQKKLTKTFDRDMSLKSIESEKGEGKIPIECTQVNNVDFQWWEWALSLLQKMKEAGLDPDPQTYTSAISACEAGGQWQRALGVLRSMSSSKGIGKSTQPNIYCFSAAISACEKGGAWLEALELYERMQEGGETIKPNFISLNSLLIALDTAGQTELAQSKYDEGRRNRIVVPWKKTTDKDGLPIKAMDLHKFSVAMAKASIRSIMEHLIASETPYHDLSKDLVIIVGKGKGSESSKSILMPTVQRILQEEYGLQGTVDKSNTGRVVLESAVLKSLVRNRRWR